jgi:hypothetical protein
MKLKIKAFIYRFFCIFGLRIYLANKEEKQFLSTLDSEHPEIFSGLWQAHNGFTSVWTGNMPFHRALLEKIKHAFFYKG